MVGGSGGGHGIWVIEVMWWWLMPMWMVLFDTWCSDRFFKFVEICRIRLSRWGFSNMLRFAGF
jgi:hypothetical protein